MVRCLILPAVPLVIAACASAPPVPPKPAGPTFEQKMANIVRLEDHRILRDATPPPAPAPPTRGRSAPAAAVLPPPPDLPQMLKDPEARVRRRAALAVGRVGLRDGVPPLVALLTDTDPEVRQMAAFALGLIGDRSARAPLVTALGDASPLVAASAAEALGLIGDPAAATPIGQRVAQVIQSGALAQTPSAADEGRRDTPAAVFRLGVVALARLKAYDALAAATLDANGQPKVRWWPLAVALGRIGDTRALPALITLAKAPDVYTRAFAAKGLGTVKDRSAVPVLVPLVASPDGAVAIEAIRALGAIGDPAAAPALLAILNSAKPDPHQRLEAVTALGGLHPTATEGAPGVLDVLLDAIADPSPAIRAAAIRSAVTVDRDEFVTAISSLDPDPIWSVRAAFATALGHLTADIAAPRLTAMLGDSDQRVIPAVLDALVALHAPNAAAALLDRLKADDPVVRAAAARGIGELKPEGGAQALAALYTAAQRDPTYVARGAALTAIAKYGAAAATPTLRAALADKDWAVRVRAASLLAEIDSSSAADVAAQIRPAPSQWPSDLYAQPRIVSPPVSTEVYLDTDRGTIEIELAVLDAPLTVENFVALARKHFFDGLSIHRVVPDFVVQDGDPRGDGEGGPGYTIRDELNERPYLRGTVGMALDWPDTGGSQFFITHSPQPHLDAKYTVFGKVLTGMDVVDAIQPGDVIRRVRVWDGTTPKD